MLQLCFSFSRKILDEAKNSKELGILTLLLFNECCGKVTYVTLMEIFSITPWQIYQSINKENTH